MEKLVFLCIGTTKITGDCLGAYVGDILLARNVDAFVYGTSQNPVTSLNVWQYCEMIAVRHPASVTVVIDATLGACADIGKLKISATGIKPGGAFFPDRKRVGDIGIMAVVGEANGDRMLELKTRDREFVENLAQKTANLLINCAF
ncbi:MAG: DUF1256 domain-containing protein [Clostridia bacterium]